VVPPLANRLVRLIPSASKRLSKLPRRRRLLAGSQGAVNTLNDPQQIDIGPGGSQVLQVISEELVSELALQPLHNRLKGVEGEGQGLFESAHSLLERR